MLILLNPEDFEVINSWEKTDKNKNVYNVSRILVKRILNGIKDIEIIDVSSNGPIGREKIILVPKIFKEKIYYRVLKNGSLKNL